MLTEHEVRTRAKAAGSWFDLCATLLTFCKEHSDALHRARDSQPGMLAKLRKPADAMALKFPIGHSPREADFAEFVEYVCSYSGEKLLLAARAVAEVLDHTFGSRFIESLKSRSQVLSQGSAIVLRTHDPRALVGDASARPKSTEKPLEVLDYVRVVSHMDDGARLRVEYDSDLDAQLSKIFGSPRPRVALGITHSSFDELDVTVKEPDPDRRFFGVTPVDGPETALRLERILAKSAEYEVGLLILPELCMKQEHTVAIKRWLKSHKRGPSLVVSGSYHAEPDGRRVNEALVLYSDGTEAWTHRKFSNFATGELGREDIDKHTRTEPLTIRAAGAWLVSTLICKDLIEKPSLANLSEVGVNLALVPALTQDMIAFRDAAGTLRLRGQAFVLVANACHLSKSVDGSGQVTSSRSPLLFSSPCKVQADYLQAPPDGHPAWLAMKTLDEKGEVHWERC